MNNTWSVSRQRRRGRRDEGGETGKEREDEEGEERRSIFYYSGMDSLPLDVQKLISQYREIDYRASGEDSASRVDFIRFVPCVSPDLLAEARQMKKSHSTALRSVGVADRIHWLRKLQRIMKSLSEVEDEKLEITSQMLDMVSGFLLFLNCYYLTRRHIN